MKLRMPINDFKPTAGYKNAAYLNKFKVKHFGMDGISQSGKTALYGLGDGIVKASGLDGIDGKTTGEGSGCGYVLVIVYENCESRDGKTEDLAVTYMHLREMPKVKKGEKVTEKTLLGYYGKTGSMVTGAHLHIQMDTDTKYPLYCCGLSSKGHSILKRGTVDSTVNPCEYLWLDDGQTIKAPSSVWYSAKDFEGITYIPKDEKGGTGAQKMFNARYVNRNRDDVKF